MPDNDLTPRQNIAITALMTQPTIKAAASVAKVSERQLLRWLKLPHFQQAVKAAECELLSELNRRLLAIGSTAVSALADVLAEPDSQALQIRAADSVLSKLITIRQLTELEQRLTELEKRMKNETD